MRELEKVCKAIVKFSYYNTDSTRRKVLYSRCLNVENEMFKLYLKTGQQGRTTFPFNELGNVLHMNHEDVVKTAKTFYDVGWNPAIHVSLTRRRFEKITIIGKSLIF